MAFWSLFSDSINLFKSSVSFYSKVINFCRMKYYPGIYYIYTLLLSISPPLTLYYFLKAILILRQLEFALQEPQKAIRTLLLYAVMEIVTVEPYLVWNILRSLFVIMNTTVHSIMKVSLGLKGFGNATNVLFQERGIFGRIRFDDNFERHLQRDPFMQNLLPP